MTLAPGIERTDEFTAADRLLTDVGGTLSVKVLSHVGAAAEGTSCTAHARLDDVVDARKLHFAVEVRDGDRTIGVGTHERRIVERAGFGA